MIKANIGIKLFWSEQAQHHIDALFVKIPQPPRHDKALVEFMNNDCDFGMEHADGSFMDHLKFCFEYSLVHYPGIYRTFDVTILDASKQYAYSLI